jgi:hypothetical protein
MSDQRRQERQVFSVKPSIENRPIASRGIGAVQLPDGIQFYKFKEAGTVRIDIVPYKLTKPHLHSYAVEGTWYERTYFVHKNVGIDKATVICPKGTFSKPCPICEYKSTLDYSDPEDLKKIKELNAQERQLFNIILPSESKGNEHKIYVLDQPRFGFGRLIDDMIQKADEDDDYQYYVDLKNGLTLKLNIEEKHTDTFKFFGVSTIEFKQRKYTYDESLLDLTVDLDTVLQITPYETIKDMFFGIGDFDVSKSTATKSAKQDENENEKERPAKLKKKSPIDDDDEEDEKLSKPKKKSPIDDDDDEDVPVSKPKKKPPIDDEDEDDDEPLTKPKKKVLSEEKDVIASKKSKFPIDDDDENESPKPKKKSVVLDDEDDEDVPISKPKHRLVDDWDDDDE